MILKDSLTKIPFFVWLVFTHAAAFSQDVSSAQRIKNYNLEKSVALQGYDPVSYFTEGKAIKGSSLYSLEYRGVTYLFASAANLGLFRKDPLVYEPQYGGWCAYAMGKDGSRVAVNPETFKILDGKLYLFYNFHFNNTLKKWNENETALKKKADASWNQLLKQ